MPSEHPDATTARSPWPAYAWDRVRRPDDLVGRTRWLFAVCCLGGTAAFVVAAAQAVDGAGPLVVAVLVAVLAASWGHRYLTRRPSVAGDVLETLAVLALAVTCTDPADVLRIAFPATWFRAMYGSSTGRALLYTGAVQIGVVLAFPARALLDAPTQQDTFAVALGTFPVTLLTTVVAHHLTVGLITREQSQRRDAALATLATDLLGPDLLGEGDRTAIADRAWESVVAICAATPGLAALGVVEGSDRLEVTRHAGGICDPPVALPLAVLPGRPPPVGGASPVGDVTVLAAHGLGGWLVLPVPEGPDTWLLLGARRAVPPDAVVAVSSLISTTALAVRTSLAHRTLAVRAHTDDLSGLANRTAFFAALTERLGHPGPGPVVLFLDLDDFKTVNDTLGHAAGDELLRILGARIRRAVRATDLCARLGGDEFAVLVDDGVRGELIAQRLVGLVASPVDLGGLHARVGVSVGLAPATAGITVEQLVQHADLAMYAAKAEGKNRVKVFEAGLLRADAQATLEAELRTAVDADQFAVHYQPVVSVPDGRVTAVEALVRWEHPTRGLLGPAEFVATAERTGVIRAIGMVVLRRACRDLPRLDAATGVPLALHVDLSAAQLTDPDFLPGVRDCLESSGIAAHRLVLEVTGSVVLDTPSVRAGLDELAHDVGVSVAVDDFGTGDAALTTLCALPLQGVTIDRTLVAGCPENTTDRTVVELLAHIARRLGLHTVAEGVERPEQLEFLHEVGVEAAQGVLFFRPAPLDELADRLARRDRCTEHRPEAVTVLRSHTG